MKNFDIIDAVWVFFWSCVSIFINIWVKTFSPIFWFIENDLLWVDEVKTLAINSKPIQFLVWTSKNEILISVFWLSMIFVAFLLILLYKKKLNKFSRKWLIIYFCILLLISLPIIMLLYSRVWFVISHTY
jgi:hypothetical protein